MTYCILIFDTLTGFSIGILSLRYSLFSDAPPNSKMQNIQRQFKVIEIFCARNEKNTILEHLTYKTYCHINVLMYHHSLKIFWDYSLHFHKWTYLHHGPWCNRHVSASRHGVRTLHWNNVIILNAYQRIRKRPVTNLKRSDLQGVPEKLCFISPPQPIPREHIVF